MPSDDLAVELRSVIKQFPNPGGGIVNAVDDVSMEIKSGEFFSMLGPSGCGKTTSLRMVAGFEWPTEGEVFIMGKPMGHKPPYLRQVNTVFQSYALFQHMTIAQNVAFGLEMDHLPRVEISRRVGAALEMVKLGGMEARKPRQLSGGQQQRVALARALVKRPQVLLLDEPLGALDLKLRKEMQLELKALQSQVGITFIYVTHDQEEALTMSDRIAVMNKGKLLQIGPPVEIYERPNCRFVADFIGETNLFSGTLLALEPGRATVRIPELNCNLIGLPQPGVVVGQTVAVSIRPEKIRLSAAPAGNPGAVQEPGQGVNPNSLAARVEEVVYIGSDTRIFINANGRRLSVWEQNRLSTLDANAYYQRGQELWLIIFAENVFVMPEG